MSKKDPYNYHPVNEPIIFDLHDSLGTKIASLWEIKNKLNELTKKEDTSSQEFKNYLKHLEKYISLLASELRIFKWANEENSRCIFEVIEKLKEIKSQRSALKHLKLNINHNIKENFNLPRYWNRQLALVFNDIVEYANGNNKLDIVNLDINLSNKTLFIKIEHNGKSFLESNLSEDTIDKINRRIKSINGTYKIEPKTNNWSKANLTITLP